MFGEWQHRRVGGVPPPTATSLMLSMSICLPQRLLDTDFSTELTSQKQSTDELCEVLSLFGSSNLFPRHSRFSGERSDSPVLLHDLRVNTDIH